MFSSFPLLRKSTFLKIYFLAYFWSQGRFLHTEVYNLENVFYQPDVHRRPLNAIISAFGQRPLWLAYENTYFYIGNPKNCKQKIQKNVSKNLNIRHGKKSKKSKKIKLKIKIIIKN